MVTVRRGFLQERPVLTGRAKYQKREPECAEEREGNTCMLTSGTPVRFLKKTRRNYFFFFFIMVCYRIVNIAPCAIQ